MKFSLLLAFLFTVVSTSSQLQENAPNIILIMADDLGYADIGCYGSDFIRTPSLDKMAADGMKFTDFHSNGAVCTPTRAALLTGNYQQRAGLEGVIYVKGETRKTGMAPSETTIAELFKKAGYATAIMGKWHLGYQPRFNPVHQGFDEFYGYVSGNVDYHSHYDNAGIYDWWHNLDTIREEGYVTDLITEHSINFIRKNKHHPFFLYVPHEAPHVPFQGRSDSAFRFPDRDFSYLGPVTEPFKTYQEMVEVMDEGIGKIMDALKEYELDNNTFVFFCSDNGARFGSNKPFRGKKGSLFEGGHRVPAIAWFPGKIKAGSETDLTMMSMDIMPTLLAVAGINSPSRLDGIDLSGSLFQQEKQNERALFWRYQNQSAVRKGDWKYLRWKENESLFNLREDIGESENLIEKYPDKTGELKQLLLNWEREMNAYNQKTN
ncbi:MAG TPA: sulfatase, partial [Prolixibacteraceae bacterium]|nr:sulfatase [Prolixibacteraceae bacterium]